jgi:hypothetical protein
MGKKKCFLASSYAVPDSDFRLLRLHSQAWLYFFAEPGKVGVKTLISFLNQLAVETPLTGAGLVAGSKQDSASLRIESEDHPPFTEFLHVCIPGRLECVHSQGSPTVAGISGVSVPAQEPPSGHPHPGRGTLVQTDQPAQRPGLSAECALKRKYAVTYIDAGSCSAAAEGGFDWVFWICGSVSAQRALWWRWSRRFSTESFRLLQVTSGLQVNNYRRRR